MTAHRPHVISVDRLAALMLLGLALAVVLVVALVLAVWAMGVL